MATQISIVRRSALPLLVLSLLISLSTSRANALSFDSDVPQATRTQILEDLSFIGGVRGSSVSPLHAAVFGPMSGSGYVRWFTDRVLSVAYDESASNIAVAYVAPLIDSPRLALTRNYTQFSHPQIARLMIIFHEARHTEATNNYWLHATCPNPFLDESGQPMKSIWTGTLLGGLPGCDSEAVGAYGSSVVLLENIAYHCETCSEKVRMDAKLYGDDQFERITNPTAAQALRNDLFGQ